MKAFHRNKLSAVFSSLKETGLGFALGAFLVLGVFVYALYSSAAWTNPTAAPTGGNVTGPIYVGTSTAPFPQTRYGTLKLGTTSPSVISNLFVYNGVVSVATTTANTAQLAVDNGTGAAINAAGGSVSGVHDPALAQDAVNMSWADGRYVKVSTNLWGGLLTGDIYNNNSGGVGIGTNNLGTNKLRVYSTGSTYANITSAGAATDVAQLTFINNAGNTGSININGSGIVGYGGPNALDIITNPGNPIAFNQGGATPTMIIVYPNVGIGTATPGNKLHVIGASGTGNGLADGVRFADSVAGVHIGGNDAGGYGWIQARTTSGGSTNLVLNPYGSVSISSVIGNVGIGTSSSATYPFDVKGLARFSADIYVKGQVIVGGGDVAEEFYTDKDYPAGTVLVMGDQGYKSARACAKKYDSAVIGVVSEQPGLVIGRVAGKYKAPVALNGVVKVRANASGGKIQKGDLLMTSAISGEAMKASDPKLGTVLGKALEDDTGRGFIMALVSLK